MWGDSWAAMAEAHSAGIGILLSSRLNARISEEAFQKILFMNEWDEQ
jgi:hypothetical protein